MMSARIGSWTVHRYDTVDSTQRVAAALIAAGAANHTAVVAERQTAGYGRKGDTWQDAPGASLLMTLIVRPAETCHVPHLAMIAALAVVDAVAEVGGAPAAIKWPNDVLINGRKVAGILGDATWRGTRLDAVRLGIGINVGGDRASFCRRSLPDATSIAVEIGRDVERDALLASLLTRFAARLDYLECGGVEETIGAWRQALATIDREVVITLRDGRVIRGVAETVADGGDVIVVTDAGVRTQWAATEVRSLRHIVREASGLP